MLDLVYIGGFDNLVRSRLREERAARKEHLSFTADETATLVVKKHVRRSALFPHARGMPTNAGGRAQPR